MILRPGMLWVTPHDTRSDRMLRFGTNGVFRLWRPRRPGTANVQIMLAPGLFGEGEHATSSRAQDVWFFRLELVVYRLITQRHLQTGRLCRWQEQVQRGAEMLSED